MPAFWEKYTFQELQEMANNSKNLVELCKKMGYAHKSYNAIEGIKKKYPNIILPDVSTPRWKKYTEKELQDLLNKTNNLEEFLEELGYSKESYGVWESIKKEYPNLIIPKRQAYNFKDLTGEKFNKLTVLERVKNNSKNSACWKCICDCGNIVPSVTTNNLISGHIQSCGCLRNERVLESCGIDLTGQRFGKLTVLERSKSIKEASGQSRTTWLCQCDCGNTVIVKTINLRSGDTQSCGCGIASHGEIMIERILIDNNIKYQKQYTFNNLVSKNNRKLRFDFGIFNENNKLCYLIEYNGLQHYESVEHFGGEIEFQKRIYNDNLKKDFCKENNIPLIIIKYNEKIEKENIIKNEYLKNY